MRKNKFAALLLAVSLFLGMHVSWLPRSVVQAQGIDGNHIGYGEHYIETDADGIIPKAEIQRRNESFIKYLNGRDPLSFLSFDDLPFTYYSDEQNKENQLAEMRDMALKITSQAKNDYEKLLLIHDWIAKNIYYYYDGPSVYFDTYDIFKCRFTKCFGYTQLSVVMLRSIGIPALGITGNIIYTNKQKDWKTSSQDTLYHDWTVAYVQNRWVQMDVTWDNFNRYENGVKKYVGIRHTYFDPSPATLANDHLIDEFAGCYCTVTVDSQSESPVESQKVNYGSQIYWLFDATRQGYTFGGWYLDASCVTIWDANTDTVTGDITLYAKWNNENTYYVFFQCRGGSTVNGIDVEAGATILEPQKPTRAGCIFTGWYKDWACTIPWVFASDKATNNIVLYAGWDVPKKNALKGIQLSAGSLTRSFNYKTTTYTVKLGENDGAVKVTPLKAYSSATLTIDGRKVSSKTIRLANGKSITMTIKVTWNKKTTTYKLTIQRPNP